MKRAAWASWKARSASFLTGQVRDVHRSLLSFQEETGERLDRVAQKVDGVDRRVDGSTEKSMGWTKDLTSCRARWPRSCAPSSIAAIASVGWVGAPARNPTLCGKVVGLRTSP